MQVKEIASKVYKFPTETEKAVVKEKMAKLRKEEWEKMTKGIFEFVDAQGGWLDFSFRFFPGNISTYRINHGEMVEIPKMLAKHLNNTYRKVRIPPTNLDNMQDRGQVTKIARCRFTPVDMM